MWQVEVVSLKRRTCGMDIVCGLSRYQSVLSRVEIPWINMDKLLQTVQM